MKTQANIIPTRQAVSTAWDAYASLCQAAVLDPQIANDPDYQTARERAHARWSRAFIEWDGR